MKRSATYEIEISVSAEIFPDIGPVAKDSICVTLNIDGHEEYAFIRIEDIGVGSYYTDERSAEDQRKTVAAKLRALADRIERA